MPKTYAKTGQELEVPKYFYQPTNSSVWYVRLVPPKHTAHAVTEREFRRSTGQSDLKLAKPVGLTMVGTKLQEWNALARAVQPTRATLTSITDDVIRDICSERLYSWMRTDDDERASGLSEEEFQSVEDFCRLTDTAMRSALSRGKASTHWPNVVDSLLDWAVDLGYQLETADARFPDLVRAFAQVERKANEGISARNRGDDAPTPPPPVEAFKTLSSIAADFITYKSAKCDEKHVGSIVNAWTLFTKFVGDLRFDSVTPGHVFDFMQAQLHAKKHAWSESRARGFGKRALREVFGLARTKGWMTIPNPVDGLEAFPSLSRAEEAAREKPRYPFTTAQLNELFESAWYDPSESKRFTGKMREDIAARYWVPLIGLFHGNRVGEAVQLVASDFSTSNESLVLGFRTEIETDEPVSQQTEIRVEPANAAKADHGGVIVADMRSLKNDATRRKVPVHPTLVELGLAEFVEARRRAAGENALLFPSSLPNPGGKSPKLGRAYEQAFLRFVRDALAFGYGFGNHSFRHQLEDRLRSAQVASGVWPAGLGQQYTGRKRTRAADRDVLLIEGSERDYGNGYSAVAMLPFVRKLDFSDIWLPPPYTTWLHGQEQPPVMRPSR